MSSRVGWPRCGDLHRTSDPARTPAVRPVRGHRPQDADDPRCDRHGDRDRRDRLPDHRRRASGDGDVRPRLPHRHDLEPGHQTSSAPARSSSAPWSRRRSRCSSRRRSAIAIGLYLSELAPRGVRGVIGSLVELLAAIPSVVLGLWGILVLGPFMQDHVEPWLHDWLGFIPLFGDTPYADRHVHRRHDPDDHGAPDRRQHQPRALPGRAERARGGRAGARRDALGDGARRRSSRRPARASPPPSSSASAARSARRSR